MSGDLDLYGLFVPELLVAAVLALAVQGLLRRLLSRAGLYRLLWHPPLADVALFVICLGGLTFLMHRI
ncbi:MULTISPECIES: DUF1656 domain-containing protein [unclassified Xanthobacter]|uniref:DUF1656 domain-containing protein n=1 Tax=unclassified Xanthobacter TaxID=2623496 RepID=UPI001EDDF390|nr:MULTISPECIES: DUF1656 domain-containing protein [unclassified Xanthobacter]